MQITVNLDNFQEGAFLNSIREAIVNKFVYQVQDEVMNVVRANILAEAKQKARELTKKFLETEVLSNGQSFTDYIRSILTRKMESWTSDPGNTRINAEISNTAYAAALEAFRKELEPYKKEFMEKFKKYTLDFMTNNAG